MSVQANADEIAIDKKARQYAAEEVVPHAGRMVLIDDIVEFNENSLSASVVIKTSSLFLSAEQGVPVRIGIEYMAQTIAAWAGVHARQMGKPIKVGYLLGSRRYQSLVTSFSLGDVLTIKVEKAYDANEIGVFECQILRRGERIVTATLNVYQPA